MTSVEVDSKRPRLESYGHSAGPALPPPHASHPSSQPGPFPVNPQLHHPHQQPHPLPPPPQQSQPHHHNGQPLPPPHTQALHSAPYPHPPPGHPSQQQTPHPQSQPAAAPPPPQPPPPHSSSADSRGRPYSSHASTLPMPHHHGADSSEPSQYHHGQQYHARHYSSEPLSARTPTTPSQHADMKHAPQYYHDAYRHGPEPSHHSPYHAHEPNTHGHIPVAHGHDTQSRLPYPTMPHQASEPPYEAWPYGQMVTVQTDASGKRKAVRASQACESCRQKKCKCDEDKPICGNCKTNGTQCHYRDVPPPKQERTMLQVMDQISGLANQINDVSSRLNHFGASTVRKEELHSELDNAIRSTIRHELRELRDDLRGSQASIKRNSDSPVPRSHFTSPIPPSGSFEGRRHAEAQPDAAYSPAGSNPSDGGRIQGQHVRRTPQQHGPRKYNVALDPKLKNFDPLAGQLSIPLEHSTAAHKLLIAWDAIHPFYAGIFDRDYAQNYVMREETQRGNLRIFGQGEGSDGIGRSHPGTDMPLLSKRSSFSDIDGSNTSTVSSADGNWGIGFDGPMVTAQDTTGGLNPDGNLNLDAVTINRLYQSFLQKMWILHPFLNKQHLNKMFERFVQRYGQNYGAYATTEMRSPGEFAKPQLDNSFAFKNTKRKRSDAASDDKGASPVNRLVGESARNPLERSMNNALLLLVFALGRICEHAAPLPPPVGSNYVNASPMTARSPPYTTPLSATTPAFGPDSSTPDPMGRSPFSDQSSRSTSKLRNIDKIPGLAYFAYAVGILGEHHGSPDLVHVQSSLLAGLYLGQMARVIDSWRWINSACTDCQLLFKDERSFEAMPAERADAIRFAYWTGLQLESDILAELDLPHSGISRLEDTMTLPNWSTLHYPPDSHDNLVIHYYWAQIHIRKILNRAHSALYNSGREPLKNPGWTIYSADDLALQLQEWRQTLPERLRWDDDAEPAKNINDARLRGKYYGARYVIHRPFLHHVLQDEFREHSAPKDRQLHTKEKEGILGMARKCISAAKSSTTSFDGLEGRLVITNIFGTTHAQFGNILVLAAVKTTKKFGWLVNTHELDALVNRTIKFIADIAPLSPTMRTNIRILQNVQNILRQTDDDDTEMQTAATSTSFSSSTN